MKIKTTLLTAAGMFLLGSLWLEFPTTPPAAAPATGAAKREARPPAAGPEQADPGPAEARQIRPRLPEAPAPPPDPAAPFARLLDGAAELERRDSPPDAAGQVRRERLLRPQGFKYPLVKMTELLGQDGTVLLERRAVVADHVMVKLRPDTTEAAFLEMIQRAGLIVRKKFPASGLFLIAAPEAELDTTDRLLLALGQGAVPLAGVEPDAIVEALNSLPGNARFAEQWSLHNTGQTGGTADADIDAPEAWAIATGSRQIVVGVIDTGIDHTHPNLAPNMWRNPGEIAGDGLDNDGNGYIDDIHGYDFFSDEGDPMDGSTHGTHVAGTIGAAAAPSGSVAGVCREVSMMAIRFLGPSGGTTSDAIDAVAYTVQRGVHLTSNSWGGGPYSALLEAEIRNAGDHGMLFVAAAGNSARNTDTSPHYPSSYSCDNIISVAATDHRDGMATFSNFGATSVDIAAPGVSILSTLPGDSYGSYDGTSMACPHVAGACALLLGIDPGLGAAGVKAMILGGADPLASQAGKSVTGGRLNLLQSAVQADPAPYLTVGGATVHDPSGNQDGVANPGETVELSLRVANLGPLAVSQVSATLSRAGSDAVLAILSPDIAVGNVPASGAITPLQKFRIRVAATPTPYPGDLRVTFRDPAGKTWIHSVPFTVNSSAIISGQVRELAAPGRAIATANVTYTGPTHGTVAVDANGVYRFTGIDGNYGLTASAPGFVSEGPLTVTVAAGTTTVTRHFQLGIPDIEVNTTPLQLTATQGQTVSGNLSLRNLGNSTLVYSVRGGQLPMHAEAASLWHRSSHRTTSGLGSWYYGSESKRSYDTGAPNAGALAIGPIVLPAGSPLLNFDEWLDAERGSAFDLAWLQISTNGGTSWTNLARSAPTVGAWARRSVNLAAHAGRTIHLRFHFDTVDANYNDFEGWYLDRLRVGNAGWLETLGSGAPLAANGSAAIAYAVDTTLLGPGVHRDLIEILSNDPDEPVVSIPVTLRVEVPGLTLHESPAAGPVSLPVNGQTYGPADPYPSVIPVTGVAGVVAGVRVRIDRLSHTWPADLDLLLEGPAGQKILLMSGAGGSTDAGNVSFSFVHGTSAPKIGATLVSGTYLPTVNASHGGLPGGPALPYSNTLDVLLGSNPNGSWKLHGHDRASGDSGMMEGWSLEFMTVGATDRFDTWAMSRFGYGSTLGGDQSDPDQDGIENLLEYALGLDPRHPARDGLPRLARIAANGALAAPAEPVQHLGLVMTRPARRADLDYFVEVSRDLQTWHHGPGHTVTVNDTATLLEVRDALALGARPKSFLRLRVERK